MIDYNICRILLLSLTSATFVHAHNGKGAYAHFLSETPVYDYAALEFGAFDKQLNLILFGLEVSELHNFYKKMNLFAFLAGLSRPIVVFFITFAILLMTD